MQISVVVVVANFFTENFVHSIELWGSATLAVISTVPDTVALFAGLVILTEGAEPSTHSALEHLYPVPHLWPQLPQLLASV